MGFVRNYLLNLGAVALRRQPQRPLLFSYYVTHRCDLNCRYCSDGDGKRFQADPIPELTTAEGEQLIALLGRSADTLDVTGGEPLLRRDLERLLACARGSGMRTILNTKGIGLPDRPDLLRFTDVLVLSLDTMDPARLAALIRRPETVARQVLAALDYALRAAGEGRLRLVLSAVATPDNLDDVAQVLDFALTHRLGFHVSPEIVGTHVNPALRGNAAYVALLNRVIRAKQQHGGVLGVPEYLAGIRDFRRFRCLPLLMPVIRPDGRLYYPCLESKQAEVSLLEYPYYEAALRAAQRARGGIPACQDCCHLFCHMALSLLQCHPWSALRENRHWAAIRPTAGRAPPC